MAEIEVGTLPDRLDDDEVALVLEKTREQLGEPDFELPAGDTGAGGNLASDISEVVLAEFMDRLEISDLGCEYYVPAEFSGKLNCGDYCVGSVFALVEILEEMMDDLDIEDVDDDLDEVLDEDDYASDLELLQAKLRLLWRTFYDAAGEAIDSELCLFVVS
jgi:hypothetical protein